MLIVVKGLATNIEHLIVSSVIPVFYKISREII
jgi:hypothetical protein